MAVPRFGRVQLQILQVLWDRGPVAAREITDALNRSSPIAHSTVQTLLRKLEKKGAVTHRVEDRTFIFSAAVKPEKVLRRATRELVDRLFAGSPGDLVSYLLRNERIPGEELREIRALMDATQRESKVKKKTAKRKDG